MYRDASGIFSLVIKRFGIKNTSVQNFATRIPSDKTVSKCLRKLKVFFNKFNIGVSSLLTSSLRAIVICQKNIAKQNRENTKEYSSRKVE